jgi:peptidoglycan/LPS O-acetylase OafA/YrhL
MRIHNIQVLRIVAAAAVVVMHLSEFAARDFHAAGLAQVIGGAWNCFPVPLFFAISGFVLTHAVRNAPTGGFLFARALRLYPGYWLAAIVVAGVYAATGGMPFLTQLRWIGWSLRPGEYGTQLYVLGPEWSLVFEATLSLALAVIGAGRRRWMLPAIASLWLAALAVKIAVRPGYAMNLLPTWETFFLSPLSVPFLLGILTYHVKDFGRSWRWAVLAGLIIFIAVVPRRFESLEAIWCVYGFASAVATWQAVQLPQIRPDHWLARAGDWSYGLYLVHIPLILGTFAMLNGIGGLVGTGAGVLLAGTVAMAGGLLYGRLECALHRRLKQVKWNAIAAAFGRRRRGAGSLPATLSGRFAGSR